MNQPEVAIDLPLEPESAGVARRQLEPFRGVMDDISFIDLCLLVDELVVEALHGSHSTLPDPIQVRGECAGDRVWITVAEGGGAYRLPSRRPEPGDPGYGLHLVQRLSDRWGMRRDHDRAMVWLEMLGRPHRAA